MTARRCPHHPREAGLRRHADDRAASQKGGPLWATPDQVAADIERAVAKGRRVVYTPWFWWVIMMIIRHLPWFVFRRLKI